MYTYDDFLEIIELLRSENGCAWDKKQTHESLRPCLMEEAAEFVSSVRIYNETGNCENMVEELGDVMLQVVMHAQIAKEEGIFSLDDIIDNVATKMVRRHPHVFNEQNGVPEKFLNKEETNVKISENMNPEQVLTNWEEIKKKEKEGKTWIENPLREIPVELPALRRSEKVFKKIDKLYEEMPDIESALDTVIANATKLKAIYAGDDYDAESNDMADNKSTEEEKKLLTDLLLNLTGVTSRRRVYAEQLLSDGIEDWIRKYEK